MESIVIIPKVAPVAPPKAHRIAAFVRSIDEMALRQLDLDIKANNALLRKLWDTHGDITAADKLAARGKKAKGWFTAHSARTNYIVGACLQNGIDPNTGIKPGANVVNGAELPIVTPLEWPPVQWTEGTGDDEGKITPTEVPFAPPSFE